MASVRRRGDSELNIELLSVGPVTPEETDGHRRGHRQAEPAEQPETVQQTPYGDPARFSGDAKAMPGRQPGDTQQVPRRDPARFSGDAQNTPGRRPGDVQQVPYRDPVRTGRVSGDTYPPRRDFVPPPSPVPAVEPDPDLYSDYEEKPRKKKKRKGEKKRKGAGGVILSILKWLLLLLFIGILAGGIFAAIIVSQVIREAPELDGMMVAPQASATYICDSSGSRQQKLSLAEANRDLVTIDRIPEDLQHAFVAIEDARYYTHNGIDIPGILRAAWVGISSGSFSEGASTITQQLLKNTIFPDWTSETTFRQRLKRKIQEQYLALKLEKLLTKDQILEDYLNMINLGAGCYGVQSAAYRYFGKDVADLTLSEDAVIACITQNPTRYNPIVNPKNNAARRKIVLDRMLEQKYITQSAYDEALADDVYTRIQSNDDTADTVSSVYTFYQDALIDQVIEDLMEKKGYSYKQAFKAVYTGGLRIYSAQDASIQAICDEEFNNAANFPEKAGYGIDYALSVEHSDGTVTHYGNNDLLKWKRETSDPSFDLLFSTKKKAKKAAKQFRKYIVAEDDKVLGERITITPQPQASVVIMDQSTGFVKAIVGGRGKKEASLTLNRATYTTRQPGSTFKILTAFAPALDMKGRTLATTYKNEKYAYSDGTPVSNWDLNDYSGTATIREAIVRSINVVAVECITEITPRLGYDYAKAFGITSLVDHYTSGNQILSDIVQPLALGGITKGVTNLELCGAYACIANEGQYIKPKFYTQVTDAQGNIVLDASSTITRTVLRSSTAALLTDAMEDVITDKTGTAYGYIDLGDMPVAGKTGTTSDYRDIWFVGYTPYYTCCIWGGYDNNDCLPDTEIGHAYSKVLWNSIMKRVHEKLPAKSFPYSGDTVKVSICKTTGMAATDRCKAYEELFALGTQPNTWCSVHGTGGYVDQTGPDDTSGNSSQGTSGRDEDAIVILSEDEVWIQSDPSGNTQGNSSWNADTGWAVAEGLGNDIIADAQNGQNSGTAPGGTGAANGGNTDTIWNENNQPDIVILP